MYQFKFADIGEGLHEGVVGTIYVKEGQRVSEGDSLFSVETDKITTDIPAPISGKVEKVLMATGETITVGQVIYHIDDDTSGKVENTSEKITKEQQVTKATKETEVKPEQKAIVDQPKAISSDPKKTLATPLARFTASKKNIDISQVVGSGPNGRILVRDVESFSPSTSRSTDSSQITTTSEGGQKRTKVSNLRKVIAKAMVNSWENVAYTNLVLKVNMTRLWNDRKALTTPDFIKRAGIKVTFLPFIMKAVVIALQEFPMFNAKYDAKTDEIVEYSSINLGMAVDTSYGLVVPVLKNAQQKSVIEMAHQIKELAIRARDRKLGLSDMQGGTFSITNFGSVGVLHGVPIIDFPEIAILGTGAIIDKVYAKDEQSFYQGKVMHLTLAADHRWVDGADMGRFLSRLKELLENPTLLGVF